MGMLGIRCDEIVANESSEMLVANYFPKMMSKAASFSQKHTRAPLAAKEQRNLMD